MGRDITEKIIEDLIEGLPKTIPNAIYISGGNEKIRKDVIEGITSIIGTNSIITDSSFTQCDYTIELSYFIRKYSDC